MEQRKEKIEMMYRRIKDIAIVAFLVSAVWGLADASADQVDKRSPNIILILADDQGWNALSTQMDPKIPGSGSIYFQTPNLERFASEGMRFSWAYSGGPTCSPSRHAIQFGRTPVSLGITGYAGSGKTVKADNQDSLMNVLKRQHPEYVAAHFGKWHMMPTPEELGYDISDGPMENKIGDTKDPEDPKQIYSLTRKAVQFMEDQVKADKPFFMQVSHYANHLKYQARSETVERYTEERGEYATKYHNDPLWAAMNDNLDESVGGILAKIKELGIEGETYVIYSADNGYENKQDSDVPAGERGFFKAYPQRGHKYTLSEGGVRVPMIVRGPGIEANSVCRTPVGGIDFLPTILDFAGAGESVPESVEGGSLVPLLKGAEKVDRTLPGMVFRYSKSHYQLDIAIVQGKYKLLKNLETQDMYLWDLEKDIGEERNLVKESPELADRLYRSMSDYFESVGWSESQAKKKIRKKKGL